MSRPTYTYKGFKLYIACPGVYSIDRLDDTYAYLERPHRGKNSVVTVFNTGSWDAYAKASAKNEGENYGDAYARKTR